MARLEVTERETDVLQKIADAVCWWIDEPQDGVVTIPDDNHQLDGEYNPDFPDEVTLLWDKEPRWRLRLERVQ